MWGEIVTSEFLWDDHNLPHIARHGVTAAEVTSLFFGLGPLLVIIIECATESADREFFGRTESGRYLLAVTEAADIDGSRLRRDL